GMRASQTEVIRSSDESTTEMSLPGTIHKDARGQRISGGRDPLGKRQPTAGCFWIHPFVKARRIRIQDRDEARFHWTPLLLVVALKQYLCGWWRSFGIGHQKA